MTTVTARLPDEIEHDLQIIQKEEKLDRSTVLRRLLFTSIQEWKELHAIEKYKDLQWSTGKAAQFAGVSIWRFYDLLRDHKVPLTYDVDDLEVDLRTLGWKR